VQCNEGLFFRQRETGHESHDASREDISFR